MLFIFVKYTFTSTNIAEQVMWPFHREWGDILVINQSLFCEINVKPNWDLKASECYGESSHAMTFLKLSAFLHVADIEKSFDPKL